MGKGSDGCEWVCALCTDVHVVCSDDPHELLRDLVEPHGDPSFDTSYPPVGAIRGYAGLKEVQDHRVSSGIFLKEAALGEEVTALATSMT